MKKLYISFLLLVLALALAACGSDAPAGDGPEAGSREIVVGALVMTEREQASLLTVVEGAGEASTAASYSEASFTSISEMLLALNSRRIDWMVIPKDVADYVLAQDHSLAAEANVVAGVSLKMAVRGDDQELLEQLNGALTALAADGTTEALLEQWVHGPEAGTVSASSPLPLMEGADTIKVGVTGDLPPLDYISADGVPAGFNVALLAAISQQSGLNIETVNIDAGSRLSALASGRIDVVFWLYDFSGTDEAADSELLTTISYYQCGLANVCPQDKLEDLLPLMDVPGLGGSFVSFI